MMLSATRFHLWASFDIIRAVTRRLLGKFGASYVSEESQKASGGSKTILVGLAAAVIAGLIGYNVGFSGGEEGLKAAQDQMKEAKGQAKVALDQLTALQVTSSEQAKKVESQTAELSKQAASVESLTSKVEEQTKQIESANADLSARTGELEKQTEQVKNQAAEIDKQSKEIDKQSKEIDRQSKEIERLRAEAKQLSRDANANNTELARLREQVKTLSAQSDDYLATIMGAIDKKTFNLVVGGIQEWLVRNRVGVGLSYVSLVDRSARITLAGESLNVVLQESQKIRLSDKSCDLTMTNIVSDSEATFSVDCGGT